MPEHALPSPTFAASTRTSSLKPVRAGGRRPWAADVEALRKWFRLFLIAWLGGGAILILGVSANVEAVLYVGFAGFIGSIIPYLKSLQYSYRVQRKLNAANLYKPGAWQVVVGGLMLNPFVLGFLIPRSVLSTVKRVERDLDHER